MTRIALNTSAPTNQTLRRRGMRWMICQPHLILEMINLATDFLYGRSCITTPSSAFCNGRRGCDARNRLARKYAVAPLFESRVYSMISMRTFNFFDFYPHADSMGYEES